MRVFHGSSISIPNPDLKHSRIDIDFGPGFYLTEDKHMAEKWAVGRKISIINEYDLNLSGLKVINLGLTRQWLDFVAYNRGYGDILFDMADADAIVGPTADDKMFVTISTYLAGFLSAEQAIKYLNVAGFSNQIVLRTEKALEKLSFIKSKEISGLQKQRLLDLVKNERYLASKSLQEMLQADKQKRKEVLLINEYPGNDV